MQTLLRDYNTRINDVSVETFGIKKVEIESDRERVYQAILDHGGITCRELACLWGVPSHYISGRFTELSAEGSIVADGKQYLPNHKGMMYPYTVWRIRI
jgi:predicted transcriptional regulator